MASTKKKTVKPKTVKPKTTQRTKASGSKVDALLEVLQQKAKGVYARLNGPASAEDLATLRSWGAPKGLVELLAKHDGSKDGFLREHDLCSVAQIGRLRTMMNGLLEEKPADFATWWQPDWLPFVDAHDGQLYALDPSATVVPGSKGQVLFYDHETGPSRSLQSFDVWVDLVITLAKKGLLDSEVFEDAEEDEEAYEALSEKFAELWSEAGAVGLAKMTDRARTKALDALPEEDDSPEKRLEGLRALVADFGADEKLLGELGRLEMKLEQWDVAARRFERREQLAPPNERGEWSNLGSWVTALHRAGRDDQAIRVLLTANDRVTTHQDTHRHYVDTKQVSAAFAVRAYEALIEKWGADPNDTFELLHTLMNLTRGEAQRRAAERLLASSANHPDAEGSADRFVDKVIRAQLVLLETASPRDRAAAFAAFVREQPKALVAKCNEYGRTLARLAFAARDWARVLEAVAFVRYPEVYENLGALAVRAHFEQSDEAGALEALKRWTKKSEGAVDKCTKVLPWRPFPAFQKSKDGALGPLAPNERDARHRAFERQCFEHFAALAPNEPYWQYGIASCSDDAQQLKAVLTGSALKSALGADETPPAEYGRLELRLLVELGQTDEALQKLAAWVKTETYGGDAFLPFIVEEIEALPSPSKAWMLAACEALWKSRTWDWPLFLVLVTHAEGEARKALLEALLEASPLPKKEKKNEPLVDHYARHIRALFENGRDDDAFAVLERSFACTEFDGRSRLRMAVPYDLEQSSTRPAADQARFLERWFETVLARFPNDPEVWCKRAAFATEPSLRAKYLDEAQKHLASPRNAPRYRANILENIRKLRDMLPA